MSAASPMRLPELERDALGGTKDALHAYAKILGAWLKTCRPRRKHWWHASLRPSLKGLTTGVVHGATSFELELDLIASQLRGATSAGAELVEPLRGQSAAELAARIERFLTAAGVGASPSPAEASDEFVYDAEQAVRMHGALLSLSAALAELRARIPEETSPIQIWPHHFDLSMIWLPGEKIAGQDPADEESSDKQMNFGFSFGDAGRPDPYLYVTAYPTPAAMAKLELPAGAEWHSEDFTGAVVDYASLVAQPDASAFLHDVWDRLLSAGRTDMLEPSA